MKKLFIFLLVCGMTLSAVLPAYAVNGKVTYAGKAQQFVFTPGSEKSPSDLFPEFKNAMPGDTLTQKILIKNDAGKEVKVKLYLRSLGAHEDSAAFLSKLGLRVQKSEENTMAYMFDAPANETAQLTDWVYLGTLYSGGEVNLDITLSVPTELENDFQNQTGYLDWEFKVEELPVESTDPKPPQTGDTARPALWAGLMLISGLTVFLLWKRKEDTSPKN